MRKDGRAPLWIRIADAHRDRYESLNIFIKPADWNPQKAAVRRSHPDAEQINALISRRLAQLQRQVVEAAALGKPLHAADLKQDRQAERADLFTFAARLVTQKHKAGCVWTAKHYQSVLNNLHAYAGAVLPFDQLTPAFLSAYEAHMQAERKCSGTTIRKTLSILRAICNRAVEQGVIPPERSPFLRYKPRSKDDTPHREKLTLEEVHQLEALVLPAGSFQELARDAWVLAFYLGGMRFGDVARLQWRALVPVEGVLWLDYVQSKTGDRVRMPVPGPALALLGRYGDGSVPEARVLPLLDGYRLETPLRVASAISARNALCNKTMKVLASRCGIAKPVTMHTARHSFAYAAQRQGIDLPTLASITGHDDLHTLKRYLKRFDEEAVEAAIVRMFG
jgi:integrase